MTKIQQLRKRLVKLPEQILPKEVDDITGSTKLALQSYTASLLRMYWNPIYSDAISDW